MFFRMTERRDDEGAGGGGDVICSGGRWSGATAAAWSLICGRGRATYETGMTKGAKKKKPLASFFSTPSVLI